MSFVDEDVLTKIRRTALKMLARRDHSEFELQTKLEQRGYPLTAIKSVLNEYKSANYLNDNRFTESFVRWRRSRGYGPLKIKYELKNKQISDELIADHLKIADNAWVLEAKTVLEKKFRGQPPQDFKETAKRMRYLQQRGFTQSQISTVVEETN